MKKTLLTLIAITSLALADFTKSGDIVTDNTTKLQWQDDEDAKTVTKSWQAAIEDYCETKELGGYTDWRLPNINELTSLVYDTRVDPAISPVFVNVASNGYWSSTTYAGNTGIAWVVDFNDGIQGYDYKDNSYYVRCVRAGQ